MSELIRLFSALDTFILRVSINLCLYKHDIELLSVTVLDHALKVGAVVRLCRIGTVDILPDDLHVIALCVFGALSDLPFNALLALIV